MSQSTTNQTNNTPAIMVLAGLVLGVVFILRNPVQAPPVDPQPDVLVTTVSEFLDLKAVCDKADKDKVRRLGLLYKAMADVLERSDSLNTQVLREWLSGADTHYLQGTDLVGAVPGFTDKRNALLASELGLDVRDLRGEELQKAGSAMRQIAKACGVD
jgi:hypothetical protein